MNLFYYCREQVFSPVEKVFQTEVGEYNFALVKIMVPHTTKTDLKIFLKFSDFKGINTCSVVTAYTQETTFHYCCWQKKCAHILEVYLQLGRYNIQQKHKYQRPQKSLLLKHNLVRQVMQLYSSSTTGNLPSRRSFHLKFLPSSNCPRKSPAWFQNQVKVGIRKIKGQLSLVLFYRNSLFKIVLLNVKLPRYA